MQHVHNWQVSVYEQPLAGNHDSQLTRRRLSWLVKCRSLCWRLGCTEGRIRVGWRGLGQVGDVSRMRRGETVGYEVHRPVRTTTAAPEAWSVTETVRSELKYVHVYSAHDPPAA